MPAGFQQAPVLKLSPDYKIFINGMDALPTTDSETNDPSEPGTIQNPVTHRSLIHDVAGADITMSIDSVPGTANFTLNVPRHQPEASAYLRGGEITITPMMEVHIYLRGRFNDENNSPLYYLAFWGIISTVQEQYSDGNHSISVQCSDILRWWEITKTMVSPTALQANFMPNMQLNALSTIYTPFTAHSIILDLGKVSMQEFFRPSQVNFGELRDGFKQTDNLNAKAPTIIAYWERRFKVIRSSMRLYGFAGFGQCTSGVFGPDQADSTAKTDGKKDDSKPTTKTLSGLKLITKVRTCDDQIQAMLPYKTADARATNQTEGQQRSKLEIAKEVAKNTHWEFFLDPDGTVVFKPPFYNLDVRANEASVIRDIDIINYTRTETEKGALTMLNVTGRISSVLSPSDSAPQAGWWIDFFLAGKFGLRHESREEWRLTSASALKYYAQAELVKHNANLQTMDITIPGRPELKMGYPMYIEPLDCFYYLYGITHSIQSGGSFTTTLSLKGKRTRLRRQDGTVRRNLAIVQRPLFQASTCRSRRGNQSDALSKTPGRLPAFGAFGRAIETSLVDLRSGKDKGAKVLPIAKPLLTDDQDQKKDETKDRNNRESQPKTSASKGEPEKCSKEARAAVRKLQTVSANQEAKKQRATTDGTALGEWIEVEDFPLVSPAAGSNLDLVASGEDFADAIQVTDDQGYLIFGPYNYGRFIVLNDTGTLEAGDGSTVAGSNTGGGPAGSVDRRHAARLIQNMQAGSPKKGDDPVSQLSYLVNPNSGAIRLDLTSMVGKTGAGVGGETFRAKAANSAQAAMPKRPNKEILENLGRVSVDKLGAQCKPGSSADKVGKDTPEKQKEAADARIDQRAALAEQGRAAARAREKARSAAATNSVLRSAIASQQLKQTTGG